MKNIIYLAIRKENGQVMIGQKGQAAFTNKTSLERSIRYAYQYEVKRRGLKKASDLYLILEVDVNTLLPNPEATVEQERGNDHAPKRNIYWTMGSKR